MRCGDNPSAYFKGEDRAGFRNCVRITQTDLEVTRCSNVFSFAHILSTSLGGSARESNEVFRNTSTLVNFVSSGGEHETPNICLQTICKPGWNTDESCTQMFANSVCRCVPTFRVIKSGNHAVFGQIVPAVGFIPCFDFRGGLTFV
jgi:hypothetical protein